MFKTIEKELYMIDKYSIICGKDSDEFDNYLTKKKVTLLNELVVLGKSPYIKDTNEFEDYDKKLKKVIEDVKKDITSELYIPLYNLDNSEEKDNLYKGVVSGFYSSGRASVCRYLLNNIDNFLKIKGDDKYIIDIKKYASSERGKLEFLSNYIFMLYLKEKILGGLLYVQ